MIDKMTQLYTAFMNMPLEGQIVAGVCAVVVLAAMRTVWKVLFPVRWTISTLFRLVAFVMNPRRRTAKAKAETKDGASVVPFDFSTRENAQAAYDFYAGTDVVQTLSAGQMEIISEAITLYSLEKNGGLGRERDRRKMQEKIRQLQLGAQASTVEPQPEPKAEVEVQKFQAATENVA